MVLDNSEHMTGGDFMFRTIPFSFKSNAQEKSREFLDRFWDFAMEQAHNPVGRAASVIFPFRVDAIETADRYELFAELPGFTKNDITVAYEGESRLTIRAERQEPETEDVRFICRERRTGTFERSFEIDGIEKSNVSVSFENGILHVVLPKVHDDANKTVFDID